MANTVDELVDEFDQLISTYREIEEKGQEPGQTSLARAVHTQVGIVSNAIRKSMIDSDALAYAKQFGTMRPSQVAMILRRIAAAIDNSSSPRQDLIIEDIQRVINSMGSI